MGRYEEEELRPRNAYMGVGDRCRLSEKTIRNAFARKPVTWQTARTIARVLQIDMEHFRIKIDNRGQRKKKSAAGGEKKPDMP